VSLDQTWVQLLIVVWGVLLAFAVPLAVMSILWHRRGRGVASMWVKYAAWFVMVPAVTIPLILGRIYMQAAFLIMSLYAFTEFARAVGLWRKPAHVWLGRIGIGIVYAPVFFPDHTIFMATPAFVILLVFLYPIARDRYQGMTQASCLTIFGVVYFGWFLAHLAFMANATLGRELILAFLLVVVVNDAAAYLIGSSLGKHKLSPNLSPNKTAEGFVGAMACTMGMMFVVRFALGGITWLMTLLLGFLLAVGGTCGDLVISLIKRDVHIKDSGTLIPGHGGLLDRLDSTLFAAPIFFHMLYYISKVRVVEWRA